MNTNKTKSRKADLRPALTEQEQCDILDEILNRTGLDYSETQLDAIDEAFGQLMNLVI